MDVNIELFLPEIIVTIFAFAIMAADLLMASGERKSLARIGIIGSLIAVIIIAINSEIRGITLFGFFVQDSVAVFFKVLFLLTGMLILYMAQEYEEKIKQFKGEFYMLILFAVLAMMFLASSNDFISLYVSLEFLAVTLYILACYTKEESASVEAGLKYLVTGALASGFLLYGITYLYGATGSTEFSQIANVINGKDVSGFLAIGLMLVVIGLTFKIASIPFHVWAPDIYQGAPTPITAFLAAGSKAAGFVILMRVMFTALGSIRPHWVFFISVISALTLLFGNLAAMPQKNIKRMLAYASIGSAGYLLMGIAAASQLGSGAIMFYLFTYLFAIAGVFLAIVIFYNSEGSDGIDAYTGLSRRSPILAATLFIGLLSLAGVPPLGGFIAKLYLIAAVVKEGLLWLAVVGVLMAIAAMYYFLLVIKRIYLWQPKIDTPIKVSLINKALLYGINTSTLVLGIYPGPFTEWVMRIANVLFLK
ncbi:MAG: NADH-quinone oxidoreductase subunit N [Deltaproteobacteria bacterium]|nr:NADH-quinone oxidoreductase subunit N [Deltaproteobacteria bacterium]